MAERYGQSPDRFRHLREIDGVLHEECPVCSLAGYPSDMMKWQSGRRVCPDDYEQEGGPVERDLRSAAGLARGAERWANRRVPKFPYTIPTSPGLTGIDPKPVEMTVGGGNVAVTLTGVNLTSDDVTLAYGADIADASPPVYSADGTQIDLLLSPPTTGGDYHLTFNGKLYRNLFVAR